MSTPISRRDFVSSAALAIAAGSPIIATSRRVHAYPRAAPLGSTARVGPNGKIGVGFIGAGKRAFELLGPFLDHPEVRVVAACDVDKTRREEMKKRVDAKYGAGERSGCPAFNDHRELLAIHDLDAVVITTPDHWHAIQCIDAAKASKDIYCEKPLTLNLAEAKAVIDAARRHERVFQTGSQQRTEFGAGFARGVEFVRSGRIGELIAVHVGVPVRHDKVTSFPCDLPEEPMEPGLDWDRWLGPAPLRPYNSVLSPRGIINHYPDWRDYREYSGGMMTDFGAHHFDIAQWGLDMDASGPVEILPPRSSAFAPKPNSTSPRFGARMVYANGVEVIHSGAVGITFIGTKGDLWVNRGEMRANPESAIKEPIRDDEVRLPRAPSHHQNWIDCIKSRERCICDAEVGARSVACCHLMNLVYWHNRPLKWNPAKWEFVGDQEANGWRDYSRRAGFELPSI